jgi:rhomboid protease GluP
VRRLSDRVRSLGDALSEDDIPHTELPDARAGVADFRRALFAQTPRVWVTPLLVGINVAVFVGMIATGVDIFSPTVDSLIKWGANYGPRTTAGEWWRLLTNVFLHIGALHIAMNMIGLWQIGFLVERLLGNRGFLVAYMVSGLCGSAASLVWNPYAVSAGASGAVFGVYGVLVAYLLRNRGSIPKEILQPLQKSALFFIGLNVVFGLQVKGIDMAAHLGGLVGGFGGGWLVVRQPPPPPSGTPALAPGAGPSPRSSSSRRVLLLAAVGLAVAAAVAALVPRVVDLQAELSDFRATEHNAVELYNGALERHRVRQLSDGDFATIIDQQVLPPWRERQQRFRSLPHLRRAQQKRVDELGAYLALRERAWSMFSQALRNEDESLAKQAQALHRQADAVLKKVE